VPVLLLFAFLSGLVTIAAPCIWPLLPVVLSTSALEGRRRPIGVTLGILISFGVVTLSISYVVHLFGLDASLLRTVAVIVLVSMGAMLVFPMLGQRVESTISRITGRAPASKSGDGLWAGFLSGLPLGIVWAPCAGPILATIATLAATREVGLSIVLVTVVYLTGIGIPLLVFALAGQRLVLRTRALSRYTPAIQRAFGAVILGTAALVSFDWDTRLQAELLDAVPSYQRFLNDLEGDDRVTAELNRLQGVEPRAVATDTSGLFNASEPAPEFAGILRWHNLPTGQEALSLQKLRGKVVLVEFWTYTCINCIRALPHTIAWYEGYRDDGLVVVGVHTPEFVFERDTSNVEQAIDRFDVPFPVAQDNDYETWKAYRNLYWPAKYLIDREGTLRRVEFGEGAYDETELAIRELLRENGADLPVALTGTPDETPTEISSPESFLGADRMINYYPSANIGEGDFTGLQIDPALSRNTFNFEGDWLVRAEYAESGGNSALEYRFHGRYVYLVMHAPAEGAGTVQVLLDGSPVSVAAAGPDVLGGAVTVDSDRLYELIDLRQHDGGEHVLRLELSLGIRLYAFTFG
jgi:cytochrome c biogenesis protein CcdA/thiol-disulfide isomerase/thioredoxin